MNKSKKTVSLLLLISLTISCMMLWAGCGVVNDGVSLAPMGETTIIENPTNDHSQYTAEQQLYILAGKLKTVKSYRSDVVGATISDSPRYVQDIHDIHIKNGDESFMQAKSTSFFVNMGKQAFFKGDRVVFRNADDIKNNIWSKDVTVARRNDYRTFIGEEPTVLSNYILNKDTVENAVVSYDGKGKYTITCDINTEKGTPRYAVKMLNYGGLNSYPTFKKCSLTVEFDKDWLPITVKTSDVYTVEKGILTMNCTSELTETFYDFDTPQNIPDLEMFRQNVNNRPSFIGGEEQEVEGTTLLSDAILGVDLANGIKVSGLAKGEVAGKNLTLPVDAWVKFDLDKYHDDGLNGGFAGIVKTYLAGIPVEIFYTGDNYLYVTFGSTKYKYLLDQSEGGGDGLDQIGGLIEIVEGERKGNMRHFTVRLKEELRTMINSILPQIVEGLPEELQFLNGININQLEINININKKSNEDYKLSDVEVVADLNIAKIEAGIVVSEMAIELPSGDELNQFEEVDTVKFGENFAFVGKLIKGVAGFDWQTGVKFNLNAGLQSVGTQSANLLFTFPASAQVGNAGLRAHLTFGLGSLVGIPSEFYLENGNLYMVNTTTSNGQTVATNVEQINILNSIVGALTGGNTNTMSVTQKKDLISILAGIMVNSSVKTSTTEDGFERVEFFMNDDVVASVNALYGTLWDVVKNADLGPMGPLVQQLVVLFDFPLDEVIIRTEYNGYNLVSMSIRLYNESTSVGGQGKDLAFVIGFDGGQVVENGAVEKEFEVVYNGINAMNESAQVRDMIAKFVENGITNLGDTYLAKITAVEEAYSQLSEQAKLTVTNYKDFTALKKEYTTLRGECDTFVENLRTITQLDLAGGKEGEIDKIINETLIPLETKFNAVQREFVGQYAFEQFAYIRNKTEQNYSVNALITYIDGLTAENYPVFADFDKAIKNAEKTYNNLLDENKAKVTNFDKIELAKKDARIVEIGEYNNSLKAFADNVNKNLATADRSKLKALKGDADKKMNLYNGFSQEEKQLITNFAIFEEAKNAVSQKIEDEFIAVYNKIGGVENIKAGNEFYKLIDEAKQYTYILTGDQKTKLSDKVNDVTKVFSEKHRSLEVGVVDDLIMAIGEVTFTNECHQKIIAARTAYDNLRRTYASYAKKVNDLVEKESKYVIASVGSLTSENVTAQDAETIKTARNLYNEACSAYKKNIGPNRKIKTALADFEKELAKMEAVLSK